MAGNRFRGGTVAVQVSAGPAILLVVLMGLVCAAGASSTSLLASLNARHVAAPVLRVSSSAVLSGSMGDATPLARLPLLRGEPVVDEGLDQVFRRAEDLRAWQQSVMDDLMADTDEDLGFLILSGLPFKFVNRHRQQRRAYAAAMERYTQSLSRDVQEEPPVDCGWAADWMGPNITKEECPLCMADGCLLWIDNESFCTDCRPRVQIFNFTYPTGFAILFLFATNFVVRQMRMWRTGQIITRLAFGPQFWAIVIIMWCSVTLGVACSSMWGFDRRLSLKQYLHSYMLGYGTAMAPTVITCFAMLLNIYWNTKSKFGVKIRKPGITIPLLVVIALIIGYCLIAFLGVSIHLTTILTSNKNSKFSQTATILAYVGHGLVWLAVPISAIPAIVRLTKVIRRKRDGGNSLKFFRLRIVIFALIESIATTIHLVRFLYYQYQYKSHLLFFTFDLLEFSRLLELVRMSSVLFLADSATNDYPMEELVSLAAGNFGRIVTALDYEAALNSDTTGKSGSRSTVSSGERGDLSVTKIELESMPPKHSQGGRQTRTDFSRRRGTLSVHASIVATDDECPNDVASSVGAGADHDANENASPPKLRGLRTKSAGDSIV